MSASIEMIGSIGAHGYLITHKLSVIYEIDSNKKITRFFFWNDAYLVVSKCQRISIALSESSMEKNVSSI